MPIAQPIFRSVAAKKQSGFGTLATGSGAQKYRRVGFGLNPQAQAIPSEELIASLQSRGSAFGTKTIPGEIQGELSAGTYHNLIGSALRKDPVAGGVTTAQTNITAAAGPPGTFTRAAGSFLTDGHRVGSVVRMTGWTTTGVANNRNFRVTGVTATVLTVADPVAAKASGDSVTITAVGKQVWIPPSGHTTDYYTFEDYFADIPRSHVYRDVVIGGVVFGGGPNQRATINLPLMGTVRTRSGTQHFTSPAAESTSPSMDTVSGSLRLNGVDIATVTAFGLSVVAPPDPEPGMFTDAPVSLGRPPFAPTGNLTIGFDGDTLHDLFDNKTEFALHVVFQESPSVNAEFVSLYLPRVVVGSPQIQATRVSNFAAAPFEVHEYVGGVAGNEQTSVLYQDSRA